MKTLKSYQQERATRARQHIQDFVMLLVIFALFYYFCHLLAVIQLKYN